MRITAHSELFNALKKAIRRLRDIARDDRGSDGVDIESRLRDRITRIAQDIQTYSGICDSFSKKRKVGESLQSIAEKLAAEKLQ